MKQRIHFLLVRVLACTGVMTIGSFIELEALKQAIDHYQYIHYLCLGLVATGCIGVVYSPKSKG